MIRAVTDIKQNINFRREDVARHRPDDKQRRESAYGDSANDHMNVAGDVRCLSRMGLSWNESDLNTNRDSWRFTLSFVHPDGDRATILASRSEDQNCQMKIWLETDDDQITRTLSLNIREREDYDEFRRQISTEPAQNMVDELWDLDTEELASASRSIFEAAHLFWKVNLLAPGSSTNPPGTVFPLFEAEYILSEHQA